MYKKYTKLLNVTVGLSVRNEEGNIENLLKSICLQTSKNYKLEEIIVVSDGSTDSTVEKVKVLHDSRIKLIIYDVNKGKIVRIQELFDTVKSDLLVIFDGDIAIASKNVISQLVRPILDNSNVGIVSGRAIPKEGQTFIEKCINTSYKAYDKFRSQINSGNNVYSAEGRVYCITRKLFSSTKFPRDLDNDDNFLYFSCITKGLYFRWAKEAGVWYKSPSNLKDHITQNVRYISRSQKLQQIFGSVISKEYAVPMIIKIKAMLGVFLEKPVYSLGIFLINLYCKYKLKNYLKTPTPRWNQAVSTKMQI